MRAKDAIKLSDVIIPTESILPDEKTLPIILVRKKNGMWAECTEDTIYLSEDVEGFSHDYTPLMSLKEQNDGDVTKILEAISAGKAFISGGQVYNPSELKIKDLEFGTHFKAILDGKGEPNECVICDSDGFFSTKYLGGGWEDSDRWTLTHIKRNGKWVSVPYPCDCRNRWNNEN